MALAPLFGLPPVGGATISNAVGVGYVTVVLAFGTLWVLVNVYQYYPLLRALTSAHDTDWRVRHAGTDTKRAPELLRDDRRLVAVIDPRVVRLYRFE